MSYPAQAALEYLKQKIESTIPNANGKTYISRLNFEEELPVWTIYQVGGKASSHGSGCASYLNDLVMVVIEAHAKKEENKGILETANDLYGDLIVLLQNLFKTDSKLGNTVFELILDELTWDIGMSETEDVVSIKIEFFISVII
jgi:hypothetical protein